MHRSLPSVARAFEIEGELVDAVQIESGHIHRTFLATYEAGAKRFRLVHQQLNDHVFRDLDALMENFVRVTTHLRDRLVRSRVPEIERRCLTPVRGRDGRYLQLDADGRAWRTVGAIEGARTVDTVERSEQAWAAARAFGELTVRLDDLRSPPLSVTIPNFHDLPLRQAALRAALRADPLGRAPDVRAEAEAAGEGFARVEEALARGGASKLPRRVVHHDCKVNNVLLDDRTDEALCVIDLDTVMEGSVLSDFGELVRTTICTAPEDEPDLARIRLDFGRFEAVARGYLAGAGELLGRAERRLLPLAGPMFALMNAIRFLTDHVEGDVYFRIHREGHNLDRARAQLRLFDLLMEHRSELGELLVRAG